MRSGGALREAVGLAENSDPDSLWRLTETDLRESLGVIARAGAALDALALGVIRELDSRVAGSQTEAIVREVTGASAPMARRDVAAARVTGPGQVLAAFGEHLVTGAVTREQVDAAVGVVAQVPVSLQDSTEGPAAGPVMAGLLLDVAVAGGSPRALRHAGAQLMARLGCGARALSGGGFDPDADQRRYAQVHTDWTGMTVGRFALDAVGGATLQAALARYGGPTPEVVDADGTVHKDERSSAQRRADAMVAIAEVALGVSAPVRGERPRIVVHATVDQLAQAPGAGLATVEGSGPVNHGALARLSCDAVLQRVTVSRESAGPLDVGRAERLVTLPQRRALEARDGGCVVCGVHPGWCDAHHITAWAAGGATDLDNLVLVCPRHHSAVHSGVWQIEKRPDGILLIPPASVDPRRMPRPPVKHRLDAILRAVAVEPSNAPQR